ncbi:MFS transporter, partial [Streptomyces sp. NPDC052676]
TATRFPAHRGAASVGEAWAATLRAGLALDRGDRSLRGALLLVPAVGAVWGTLDEYTPLLARETGVADAKVPYLLLLIWAGATAGGLLAGPAERLGRRGLAGLLAGAGLALAAGAATGTPAGLLLVALAFGGFQLATVLADARLQRRVDASARATLTSVAGLGTGVATVAVHGSYAALSTATGHATAFTWFAVPYLVTAALLWTKPRRRLPSGPSRR